jgi:uncharacterized protein (DUF1810 family)
MTRPETLEFSHFLVAQEPIYDRALAELRAGEKQSHWMWFIFPQLRGLGRSSMSTRYAIDSLAQAERYLAHPLLGLRLRECTRLMLELGGRPADAIFGPVDCMKFHSSLTLFSLCSPATRVFADALAKYFNHAPDRSTLALLKDELDRRTSG